MTRTMYDSVTATDIPRDAQLVAGYVSGRYRWSAADWARFPNAVKVRIATQASVNDGHVLDVEPGDAEPWQAPDWVRRRRAAGVDPTVYCNQLNGWPAVRQAFVNQHVPEPHYWVARYDGKASIPAGAVAKQYANQAVHGRGHYDLSIVADYWPGVDQPQEDDLDTTEHTWLEETVLRLRSIHTGQWGPPTGNEAGPLAGGDLTWFDNHVRELLAEALADLPPVPVELDYDRLSGLVDARIATAVANEIDRRARDNDPTTGPAT